MTEEENKAVDCLKIVVDDINECGAEYYIDKDISSDIQTALNLIEKLKKENERKDCKILNLAVENTGLHKEINERVKLKIENEKIVDEEFIPKEKIRKLLNKKVTIFTNDDDYIGVKNIEKLLEEE